MFALPIYLSYHVSDGLQYYVSHWLTKLSQISLFQENKLQHILFGHYGVISLGTYSFVWALPVVFMISLSTALIDITHLKHYIVWSIEPTMMRLGLHGSDIIPLLEGFGCNAAAITQATHQCHRCTKVQCMSLVSFELHVVIKLVLHYRYSTQATALGCFAIHRHGFLRRNHT